MRFWRRKVMALTKEEILEAVDNHEWQEFRISLKGIPTTDKLDRLNEYLERPCESEEHTTRKIRVDNYINALLRGGQLKKICNEMLVVGRK